MDARIKNGALRLRMALNEEFGIPVDASMDTRLVEDLGLDSVRIMQLIVLIEDEAEAEAALSPDGELYPMLDVLEDVYSYFETLTSADDRAV